MIYLKAVNPTEEEERKSAGMHSHVCACLCGNVCEHVGLCDMCFYVYVHDYDVRTPAQCSPVCVCVPAV